MRPSTAPAGVERFALSRGEAAFMACFPKVGQAAGAQNLEVL